MLSFMTGFPWRVQFSAPTVNLAHFPDGSRSVNFPSDALPKHPTVNYVDAHVLKDISAFKQLHLAGLITGDNPVFKAYNGSGGGTPHARLFIQRSGDDGTVNDAAFRWWSNPLAIPLALGAFDLTVPLTVDQWSDVTGGRPPAGFLAALKHMANIGFTFGGTFFGHGVNVTSGAAAFNWTMFQAEP